MCCRVHLEAYTKYVLKSVALDPRPTDKYYSIVQALCLILDVDYPGDNDWSGQSTIFFLASFEFSLL